MIDKSASLYVKYEDNTVFSDYSHKCSVFGRDSILLSIDSANDYMYIGFKKPINAFYVNLIATDGAEGSLSLQYYNGTEYTDVSNLSDDTFGFYRSGFIRWDRDQEDQALSTVDSVSTYWYKLTFNTDRTDIALSGLNLVFSDDYELSLLQPYISDVEFLGSAISHVKMHAAAKKEIIQKFRNQNYIKYNINNQPEDINIWDLHDIEEVRLGATYLALAKIYDNLSDNPEDVWANKSMKAEAKYNKYIELARVSLDVNDDGKIDEVERKNTVKTRYIRR